MHLLDNEFLDSLKKKYNEFNNLNDKNHIIFNAYGNRLAVFGQDIEKVNRIYSREWISRLFPNEFGDFAIYQPTKYKSNNNLIRIVRHNSLRSTEGSRIEIPDAEYYENLDATKNFFKNDVLGIVNARTLLIDTSNFKTIYEGVPFFQRK